MSKEIKLSPNISVNDVKYRILQAKKFLEKGEMVRLTLTFKGREIVHPEIGRNVIEYFVIGCYDNGRQVGDVKLDGKRMTVMLRPIGKKDKTNNGKTSSE